MFKTLFNRLFGAPNRVVRAAPVPPRPGATRQPPPAATEDRSADAAAVRAVSERPRLNRGARPEELCGLSPGMTQDQIRDHLASLYRRHNRAASSLEADLREEAELMLDAIVRCRETFLGVPATKPDAEPPSRESTA